MFIGPTNLDPTTDPWKSRPDFPSGLVPWCADNPYCGGILTPSWRWDNIEANREAAEVFLAFIDFHFPGVRANLHWYVTYEGYFDWLGGNSYSDSIRSAYGAYLFEMVKVFNNALEHAGEPPANSSRAVLWSPAYESPYHRYSQRELNSIRDNLRHMFANVQTMAAGEGIARGVDWLDMQDKLGQTDCYSVECYSGVGELVRLPLVGQLRAILLRQPAGEHGAVLDKPAGSRPQRTHDPAELLRVARCPHRRFLGAQLSERTPALTRVRSGDEQPVLLAQPAQQRGDSLPPPRSLGHRAQFAPL